MGDKRRGRVFAKYIIRNFPSVMTVLSVADGNLNLTRELYHQYKITVVDPKIRNRNQITKKHVEIIGKLFTSNWKQRYDLIIGMHPDEATGEIIDYCLRTNIPCAIVPCCCVGRYSRRSKKGRWVKFIKNLFVQGGWQVYIDELSIRGDSLVVRAYPNHYRKRR